ncbi:MAG: hypothetical protein EBT30_08055 [Verrucomicrobia bacterium]|nr:hypothetical protein [Verrucomicrobiota bacterium]
MRRREEQVEDGGACFPGKTHKHGRNLFQVVRKFSLTFLNNKMKSGRLRAPVPYRGMQLLWRSCPARSVLESILIASRIFSRLGRRFSRREFARFFSRLRAYAFVRAGYPSICKRIGRQLDKLWGTAWEAFFHNREIDFHRNDYHVPHRAWVFVHVPRTGGTSVGDYIQKVRVPRILNLHAHHPISVVCPPAFHRYFTILRDPVERCWSFYRLSLYRNDANPYRRAAARGLEHFCLHCWEMRNMYCRYYSGIPWQEPDETTLEEAFRQLRRFEAVLDFSQLGVHMGRLAFRWGVRRAAFPHRNQAPGPKVELDALSRKILERHNELDLRLYAHFRGGWIKGFESGKRERRIVTEDGTETVPATQQATPG